MKDDHADVDRDELLRLWDKHRAFLRSAPINDKRLSLTNRVLRYLFRERANLDQVASLWGAIANSNLDADAVQPNPVLIERLQRLIRLALSVPPSATAMTAARDVLLHSKDLTDDQITHVSRFVRYIMRNAANAGRVKAARDILERSRIAEDGLATIADAEWLDDDRFKAAYAAGSAISVWGHDIRYRAYILMKCAERAASLAGDFVECGVDRGGTATCVIEYVGAERFSARTFYLFDTFCGLVPEQLTDEERVTTRITTERYPNVLDSVRQNFSRNAFVRIVPGAVPDTLSEFRGDRIAFLHIDMNAVVPECAAFEALWPKLSVGAPVVFDDYGFPFHAPQRRALDVVAKRLGTQIMMLPTCQGLAWKI